MSAPRLLFIAHCFPPVTLPGAVRAAKICKFLAARGWKVTVVTPELRHWAPQALCAQWTETLHTWGVELLTTPQPFAWRIGAYYSTPSRGLRWFAEGVGRRIFNRLKVGCEALWVERAMTVIEGLDGDDVDVVLATASPYVSFPMAQRASKALDCPFVLDYRDLWGTSPHPLPWDALDGVEAEGALLTAAHGVLGVSDSLVQNLRDNFAGEGTGDDEKYQVLTNGFDADDMQGLDDPEPGSRPMVYAGIFYPPKRVITPIMEALRWIKSHRPERVEDVRFICYGIMAPHVREEAKRCGVADMVEHRGRVPRRTALAAIAHASLSVVITSVETQGSQADRGIVTSKIFDAMGLGTPVLLIAPEDSDAERILDEADAGQSFRGQDIEGIANAILRYTEAAHPGANAPTDSPYAWPQLASRLDGYLRDAMARYQALSTDPPRRKEA